ncbi:MAG TPA: hypothetical protein VLY24_13155 [Bryobacteraceae bacterium]|nr:hypothetical protein [Bryobacteraceae bacterium]
MLASADLGGLGTGYHARNYLIRVAAGHPCELIVGPRLPVDRHMLSDLQLQALDIC